MAPWFAERRPERCSRERHALALTCAPVLERRRLIPPIREIRIETQSAPIFLRIDMEDAVMGPISRDVALAPRTGPCVGCHDVRREPRPGASRQWPYATNAAATPVMSRTIAPAGPTVTLLMTVAPAMIIISPAAAIGVTPEPELGPEPLT